MRKQRGREGDREREGERGRERGREREDRKREPRDVIEMRLLSTEGQGGQDSMTTVTYFKENLTLVSSYSLYWTNIDVFIVPIEMRNDFLSRTSVNIQRIIRELRARRRKGPCQHELRIAKYLLKCIIDTLLCGKRAERPPVTSLLCQRFCL